jgi:hypothetical protein
MTHQRLCSRAVRPRERLGEQRRHDARFSAQRPRHYAVERPDGGAQIAMRLSEKLLEVEIGAMTLKDGASTRRGRRTRRAG